jgi:drug/metabolite transporter (DMT)-like permease
LILGTVCTSLAYVAGVAVMKELSAFRVALITNLEPVYGIILAFMFFGKREQMTPGFYAGAIIVLGTIFLHPYIKSIKRKQIPKTPIG